MKVWNRPEIKVFSVRLDENIATSGAVQRESKSICVQQSSVLASYWPTNQYYVNSVSSEAGTIVDTDIAYVWNVTANRFQTDGSYTDPAAISSCLV